MRTMLRIALATGLLFVPAFSGPEGGEPTAADWLRKGRALREERSYEEERAAYREAIRIDPGLTDAHGHLAMSNYTAPGGSIVTVVDETRRFLETSPHREYLGRALADWEVYGNLRKFGRVMAGELKAAAEAKEKGESRRAAAILEKAAAGEVPDVYVTVLLAKAGHLRREAGDPDGARRSFLEAIRHANCRWTIDVRLGLAILDVEAGDLPAAFRHLRAAVAEGSAACGRIEDLREDELAPLFGSGDEAVRAEVARLTDEVLADAPIRAEIDRARAKAGREGKRVLLMWYGPYCPYVMAIEERLAHPRVRGILDAGFVFVRMNQGSLHRGRTLEREYGDVFMALGVPSFMVLEPDGSIFRAQKDALLMDVPHRSFSVDLIADWLEAVAPCPEGPDLGEGEPYGESTLLSFRRLLSGGGWSLADPPRNSAGLLVVRHEMTGLPFVLLPGGSFDMGADGREKTEAPVHSVRVPPFLMCATECTQEAWDRVGGEDTRRWRGSRLPVEGVSKGDVESWAKAAGLRLPSEAEWEYGCRAGTDTKWCSGDDPAGLASYAWFLDDEARRPRTHPVGLLAPNAWGLQDMHGNVWEWVADFWHDTYEGAPEDGSAWISEGAGEGLYRGGCWLRTAYGCRSAFRQRDRRDRRYWHLGFRPAFSLPVE